MECFLRPMMTRTSSRPAPTASSTTYSIAGLSTTGSISLGVALVAGRNLVPRPAAGITALVTSSMSRTLANSVSPARLRAPFEPRPSLLPRSSVVSPVRGGALRLAVYGGGVPGDQQDVRQEKVALRARVLAARSELTEDQRRGAGRLI